MWIALILGIASALADEPAPTRALRAGLSFHSLVNNPFEGSSPQGLGALLVYEFFIGKRFRIGLPLSYRVYFGDRGIQQYGYGVILKHYLVDDTPENLGLKPFFEYCLGAQNTRQPEREGSATSDDERLSVGTDFRVLQLPLFTEISYHFSNLNFFDRKSTSLGNVELSLGTRWVW